MSAAPAAKLYTPELLGLAVELAAYPLTDNLALMAETRSRSCGSVLAAGFSLAPDGAIELGGYRVSACAVGQAAVAIFAADAKGRSAKDIANAYDAVSDWLDGSGPLPSWPRLEALAPALPHQGRHEAIKLPWKAACAALCNGGKPR